MRKRDKLKNYEQANIMLEQSYLKSKGLLKEDNLEVKSIAKKLYSWLKQNGVNTKLVASKPNFDSKQIGSSLKGESNEALVYYYDDPKTKQTVIEISLRGGATSKDLVLQVEKKLLSTYPGLEQYDRQEIPTQTIFMLNFRVREKTTAKGGLVGNTKPQKKEPEQLQQ